MFLPPKLLSEFRQGLWLTEARLGLLLTAVRQGGGCDRNQVAFFQILQCDHDIIKRMNMDIFHMFPSFMRMRGFRSFMR